MAESLARDPVLSRFRTALNEFYGQRLERVVLFGSRARGDARPDCLSRGFITDIAIKPNTGA
jgi:predicted nucleotidyltransferase